MPLGMMAKDSIQDFTLLLSDAEDKLTEIPHDKDVNAVADEDGSGGLEAVAKMESLSSSNNNNKQQIMSSNSDDATTSSAGSCCSAATPANPQQAQEEDEDGQQRSSPPPSSFAADAAPRQSPQRTQEQSQQQQQQNQYAGFKSDYWGQQYYNNNNNNAFQANMKNNTYAGAYDSSYFYDPYATTTTTSGISSARAAASNNNTMFLLDRNKQLEPQFFTLFRCLLPCLFPWQQQLPPTHLPTIPHDLPLEEKQSAEASVAAVAAQQQKEENEAVSTTTTTTREKAGGESGAVVVDDAEEVASNASDKLGEKLSDRERQAVMARLRLAQPELEDENKKTGITENGDVSSRNVGNNDDDAAAAAAAATAEATSSSSKGLLPEAPPEKPLKSILKRRTTMIKGNQDAPAVSVASAATAASTASIGTPYSDGTGDGGGSKKTPPPGGPRRSLFPQYSLYGGSNNSADLGDMALSAAGQRRTKQHHATFSPMARVMTIKSKNEMTPEEKGDIWWIKSDYEDFRKAGRIIARAMVEGGSDIWLAFSRSCRAAAKKKKKAEQAKMNQNDGNVEKVSCDEDDDDDDDKDNMTAISCDKWWHEFGHSRRGLEHVVSIEEGRQRQQNVRNAIQAVLEEQARQKLYRRQVDADKLRKISLQYTTWARDLALASGSSDADAVKSSFADSRKSREFYLSELITNNSSTSISSTASKNTSAANTNTNANASVVTIPDFMRPSSVQENSAVRHTIAAPTADILDANTAAQIRYRRKKNKDAAADKNASSTATTLTSETPVHDGPSSSISSGSTTDDGSNKTESMAHRAAGFSAEGDAKISAAAVLSGMGAVPQNSNEVISTAC